MFQYKNVAVVVESPGVANCRDMSDMFMLISVDKIGKSTINQHKHVEQLHSILALYLNLVF